MKILITNKDARRSYEIIDTFRGGMVLSGAEVKSLKQGQGSLKGSFIITRINHKQNHDLLIKNMYIPPFQQKNTQGGYDSERIRSVLVTKKEQKDISKQLSNRGSTLIPLQIIQVGQLIKVDFCVARGLKKHDKREKIKKHAAMREAGREAKSKIR